MQLTTAVTAHPASISSVGRCLQSEPSFFSMNARMFRCQEAAGQDHSQQVAPADLMAIQEAAWTTADMTLELCLRQTGPVSVS